MLRKFNLSLIFILALFVSTAAISQTSPAPISSDSVLVKELVAIPEIDIIEQLAQTNKELKKIEERNKPKKIIAVIDSLLPQYVEFLKQNKVFAQGLIKANPNRQKIDNLINKWLGYRELLEGWQTSINDGELSKVILLDQTSKSEIIWEMTYQYAVEKEIPAEVLNRIKVVMDSYNRINTAIAKEENIYLNLENKISDQITVIDAVVDELNSLKNSEVYDLFHLRHAPFWKKLPQEDMSGAMQKIGVESVSENISSTWNYVKSKENTIYFFFITLFFSIAVIFLIKNSFLKYPLVVPSKHVLKAKEIIVDRTLLVILFLTLVLLRLFFPNTPKLFYDILVTLMLISAIVLVRPYLYKKFQNVPFFFILILILDLVKTYMWLPSFQYRLYLLFETSLILAVLIYFTYPFRKSVKSDFNAFGLLLTRFIPIAYVLVAITYVSNIFGYTNFTDFIIKLCVQGGDLTLIFYAIILVLNGLILGFIHYHFNIRLSEFIPEKKRAVEAKLNRLIRVFAFLLWLFYFLTLLDLYSPLSEVILDIFSEPYKVGTITFSLGTIFMFVAILSGSYIITRMISFLLDGNEIKLFSFQLPKGIPAAISLVIRYFILAFGVLLALSYVGINLSEFNLLAGALGLGIGFGLQTIVSNFISGIILIFERPILPGDVVEVNNLLGTVSKIGVRASRINTYEGAEVVVPNNNLISKDLINWTLSDNIKRVEILIGTAYGTNPNEVLKILKQVANENQKVLKNTPPVALFDTFGESSLNFRLLFWVHFQNGLQAKSDVSIAVYNRFEELGIKIPFPQHEVYLSQKDNSKLGPSTDLDIP